MKDKTISSKIVKWIKGEKFEKKNNHINQEYFFDEATLIKIHN